MEYVAGEALRMDTDQRRRAVIEGPHTKHGGLFDLIVDLGLKTENAKDSVLRRKVGFGHFAEP
jgi:hypothetical protein